MSQYNEVHILTRANNFEIIENIITITEKLIDDTGLRDKYALEGRKMIETTFEWEKLVGQMDSIYKKKLVDE